MPSAPTLASVTSAGLGASPLGAIISSILALISVSAFVLFDISPLMAKGFAVIAF